jgi:hypothetical protein
MRHCFVEIGGFACFGDIRKLTTCWESMVAIRVYPRICVFPIVIKIMYKNKEELL